MNIRQARARDYPEILRIYNQAVLAGGITGDEHTLILDERKPWLEQHNGRHYAMYIAESGTDIMGYLALSPYRYGRSAFYHTAEISYYVDETYRRQGVATALIEHALQNCKLLEIGTLIAILLSGNKTSINLLEKHGFSEWGRMPQIARLKSGNVDHLYYGKHLMKI